MDRHIAFERLHNFRDLGAIGPPTAGPSGGGPCTGQTRSASWRETTGSGS